MADSAEASKTTTVKNEHWSDNETSELVNLLNQNLISGNFDGTVRDNEIYKRISAEFKQKGSVKTPVQVKNKIKSLKRKCKETKDELNKSGAGSSHKFKYFKQMGEVLGCRDNINPVIRTDLGLENIEISTFIPVECTLDKSAQDSSFLLTDDELAFTVEEEELLADVDTSSISIDPQPSTSQAEIKRKCTGYGRKRRKINVMEEALKNVLKETTDRILKFEEEVKKAAEEKREQFRQKILEQNEEMLNLLRTIADK